MSSERQNRIDAYLRDEMTPLERTAFEKEVEEDSTLAKELILTRKITETLQIRQMRLKKIQKWEQEESQETYDVPCSHKQRHYWGMISTALAASLLIGYLIYQPSTTECDYVYDAKFFQNESVYRGTGTNTIINQLITDGQYTKALNAIDSLELSYRTYFPLITDADYHDSIFSEEELYNQQLIRETLYQLSWQRIHALIAQDKISQALPLLRKYELQTGEYQEKAKILLKQLQD